MLSLDAVAAAAPSGDLDPNDIVREEMPLLPLSKRIQYTILWFLWTRLLNLSQYYNNIKTLFVPPAIKPADLVKRYPVRPSLSVRCVLFCLYLSLL